VPAGEREASPRGTSVPPPRFHTIHYAGVLAAASPWRSRISAQPPLGGRRLHPLRVTMKSQRRRFERADIGRGQNSSNELWVGRPRLRLLPGANEAPRRGEEPAEHHPLPGCSRRTDRRREASPWGMPSRSPGRGPPYWKSRVLRRQALGDQSEREAWPRATAGTTAARASAKPGLYIVPKSFSDVSAKAWHSATEAPPKDLRRVRMSIEDHVQQEVCAV